jgi:hypothetical protein
VFREWLSNSMIRGHFMVWNACHAFSPQVFTFTSSFLTQRRVNDASRKVILLNCLTWCFRMRSPHPILGKRLSSSKPNQFNLNAFHAYCRRFEPNFRSNVVIHSTTTIKYFLRLCPNLSEAHLTYSDSIHFTCTSCEVCNHYIGNDPKQVPHHSVCHWSSLFTRCSVMLELKNKGLNDRSDEGK